MCKLKIYTNDINNLRASLIKKCLKIPKFSSSMKGPLGLPKGKMIEGRSGGSGRGTRRESWAPPDSGSAQRRNRRFVSCTRLSTRSRSLRRPRISFPPPLPQPSHLPAGQGKIPPHPSARSALHSSPQDGGPKGKMIEGRSGGSWRGTRRESWAPPDSGPSTRGSYVVSCTDARPSPPTHFIPSPASPPRPPPSPHRGT